MQISNIPESIISNRINSQELECQFLQLGNFDYFFYPRILQKTNLENLHVFNLFQFLTKFFLDDLPNIILVIGLPRLHK